MLQVISYSLLLVILVYIYLLSTVRHIVNILSCADMFRAVEGPEFLTGGGGKRARKHGDCVEGTSGHRNMKVVTVPVPEVDPE